MLNPDERPYKPRGNLREIWSCREPEVVVEGPAGTGKSRAILELIHARAEKYPGSRHLLLRKTRAAMTDSVLVTFENTVLPVGCAAALGPSRAARHSYSFPNRSEIVIGGLDRPERTFSTEYDTVVVFEATECTENDWQLLFRALRHGKMGWGHQAICDCNPAGPTHWINQRANRGHMHRVRTRHEDNPILFDDGKWTAFGTQYIAVLDRLSGVRWRRLRKGEWAAAEGAVFEGFDPTVHVIDPFPVPDAWKRIRSIDFGYVNPFVCQWWAVDGDGRLFMYREMYHSQRLVEDHAKQILALTHKHEPVEISVSDHDAEDRATLDRHGVRTRPARKDLQPGIQAVAARLRPAGDGRPRLFFFRDCLVERDGFLEDAKLPLCTVQEFDGYVWAPPAPGKPPKEEPVDKDNHGMDAMRYAVAHFDLGYTGADPGIVRPQPEKVGLPRIYSTEAKLGRIFQR